MISYQKLAVATTGAALSLAMIKAQPAQAASLGETVVAPFTGGTSAVTTSGSYQGLTDIVVSGRGQAAKTQFTDAFYKFTDANGNSITPVPVNAFGLYIDGQSARTFFPSSQQSPAYSADHTYSFQINAPGGPLRFGVGDVEIGDNTGSYTITSTSAATSTPTPVPEPSSILGTLVGTAFVLKRTLKRKIGSTKLALISGVNAESSDGVAVPDSLETPSRTFQAQDTPLES